KIAAGERRISANDRSDHGSLNDSDSMVAIALRSSNAAVRIDVPTRTAGVTRLLPAVGRALLPISLVLRRAARKSAPRYRCLLDPPRRFDRAAAPHLVRVAMHQLPEMVRQHAHPA